MERTCFRFQKGLNSSRCPKKIKYLLCFVEKIHATNIKCIPFFTPLPSLLFLVVSCFCAACLREEFGGWGPFCLIAYLRVFSVWCMLAWKFIFSTKHCSIYAPQFRESWNGKKSFDRFRGCHEKSFEMSPHLIVWRSPSQTLLRSTCSRPDPKAGH